MYGEWTGQLPIIAKYITALYVCKYKIHVYYIKKQRKSPAWVRPAILVAEILAILLPTSIQIVNCLAGSPTLVAIYMITVSLGISLSIMIFSAFMMVKIVRMLNYGIYREKRKWLYILEVFLQLMLIGRIVLLISSHILKLAPVSMKVVVSLVLLCTELIPFALIVWNMIIRLKVYNKARRVLSQSISDYPSSSSQSMS